jgi:hypothetical protein
VSGTENASFIPLLRNNSRQKAPTSELRPDQALFLKPRWIKVLSNELLDFLLKPLKLRFYSAFPDEKRMGFRLRPLSIALILASVLANSASWLIGVQCASSAELSQKSQEQVTSDPLEAVFQQYRVKSVDDFLARPEVIDAYYEAAQNFFGGPDAFPRSSYDAILRQLRTMSADPASQEFKTRLFETTHLGHAFSIHTESKSYGRELGSGWYDYLEHWKEDLSRDAAGLLQISEDARTQKLKSIYSRLESEQNEYKQKREGMKRSDRENLDREYFGKMKTDPELAILSSYLLYEALGSNELALAFESGNPDLILTAITHLREAPIKDMKSSVEIPDSVSPLLRAKIPSPETLLADQKLFPQAILDTANGGKSRAVGANADVTYDFTPVARRFHGIWKGIPLNECVGGSCDHFDKLTPERWGTIGLKDAQLHWITVDKSYRGYVNQVPVQNEYDHQIYASVDYGSSDFNRAIFVKDTAKDTDVEKIEVKTLFSQWLKIANKQTFDPSWKGAIKTGETAFHNAGVLPTIFTSSEYQLGRAVPGKMNHLDSTPSYLEKAAKLVQPKPVSGYEHGDVYTDATFRRPSEPVLLDPNTPSSLSEAAEQISRRRANSKYGDGVRIQQLYYDERLLARPSTQRLLARVIQSHMRRGPSEQEHVERMVEGILTRIDYSHTTSTRTAAFEPTRPMIYVEDPELRSLLKQFPAKDSNQAQLIKKVLSLNREEDSMKRIEAEKTLLDPAQRQNFGAAAESLVECDMTEIENRRGFFNVLRNANPSALQLVLDQIYLKKIDFTGLGAELPHAIEVAKPHGGTAAYAARLVAHDLPHDPVIKDLGTRLFNGGSPEYGAIILGFSDEYFPAAHHYLEVHAPRYYNTQPYSMMQEAISRMKAAQATASSPAQIQLRPPTAVPPVQENGPSATSAKVLEMPLNEKVATLALAPRPKPIPGSQFDDLIRCLVSLLGTTN